MQQRRYCSLLRINCFAYSRLLEFANTTALLLLSIHSRMLDLSSLNRNLLHLQLKGKASGIRVYHDGTHRTTATAKVPPASANMYVYMPSLVSFALKHIMRRIYLYLSLQPSAQKLALAQVTSLLYPRQTCMLLHLESWVFRYAGVTSLAEFKSFLTPEFKGNKHMQPQLLTDLITTVGILVYVQSCTVCIALPVCIALSVWHWRMPPAHSIARDCSDA